MTRRTSVRRRVTFHTLHQMKDGVHREFPIIDWADLFQQVSSLPLKDRTVDELIYVPGVDGEGRPKLAIHKPLSTAFMSQIRNDTMEIQDAGIDDLDALYTHSTAVVILPELAAFGTVAGSGQMSPGAQAVVTFLEHFLDSAPGVHYGTSPLMDVPRLAEFRDSDGIYRFSATLNSEHHLFAQEEGNGVYSYLDTVAQQLGSEVTIELSIKVPHDSPLPVTRKLKNLVAKDESRLTSERRSKARVAALKSGVHEELNLVAARFAVERDITKLADGEASFSRLMDLASDVVEEYSDRIEGLRRR